MATYAIGDIHGCFDSLQALWAQIPFDPAQDELWQVGDLVNRGPKSLEVLRWARELHRQLGSRFQVVLGNHDLHLMAVAAGLEPLREGDTLDEVLAAPDRSRLLKWLAGRPLIHRRGRALLIHAGLPPSWTPSQAERKARKVEKALAGKDRRLLLDRSFDPSKLRGNRGRRLARLHRTLVALTRLRTCSVRGEPCRHSGPPAMAPKGCLPWFDVPGRRTASNLVVCGHWAALGWVRRKDLLAIDTGCAWGGRLSAVRVEDGALFQQQALETGLTRPPEKRPVTASATGTAPKDGESTDE
jgi:bis(5'-nucleosyl)-tetraphosphatase (symmetrical)